MSENIINPNSNFNSFGDNLQQENNNFNYELIIRNDSLNSRYNNNYQDLQNQLINNNNSNFIEKFSSQEIYEILNDLIPSIIYSVLILYSFKTHQNYCDMNVYLMLKILLVIYAGYILNSLFRSYLIYANQSEKNILKISLIFISSFISTFYVFSIFISYFIYNKNEPKCFIQDNFTTIVFYGLFFIGMVNIFQLILNFLLVCASFILMVNSFLSNPSFFYAHYGVDPEIIKNLPTINADKKHESCCVICTEDIKEGDEIMILKCPAKHYFHANCIKSWLLVKTTCPMCRSENVF